MASKALALPSVGFERDISNLNAPFSHAVRSTSPRTLAVPAADVVPSTDPFPGAGSDVEYLSYLTSSSPSTEAATATATIARDLVDSSLTSPTISAMRDDSCPIMLKGPPGYEFPTMICLQAMTFVVLMGFVVWRWRSRGINRFELPTIQPQPLTKSYLSTPTDSNMLKHPAQILQPFCEDPSPHKATKRTIPPYPRPFSPSAPRSPPHHSPTIRVAISDSPARSTQPWPLTLNRLDNKPSFLYM